MKKYLLLTIGLLMIFACGKPKTTETVVTKKSVKLQVVKNQILNEVITGNGNFEPVSQAEHTSVAADVVRVNFKNGDRVKAGDVVVVLYDKSIKANYESAKANLMKAESDYNKSKKFSEAEERNSYEGYKASMINAKEALDKAKRGNNSEDIDIGKSNVEKAQKSYEQAKFNYDKYKKLYEEKLISQSSFIGYETEYVQAKASLNSAKKSLTLLERGSEAEDIRSLEASYNRAKSNYELAQKNVKEKIWSNNITSYEANYLSAKASYDLAKKEYDDLTVRAKIAGVVANLSVKANEKTSGTGVLFYVIEDKEMEVSLGLNASEIVKISLDSKVQIFVDELNKTYEGQVTEISPAADETTKKFAVKVKAINADNSIKKGLYAKVTISGQERNMMVVPSSAVVVKNLYKYVFKEVSGKAKQVKIELGSSSGDYQEILTEEIKQGDKIVIDGQYLLQDNDLIEEVK